MRALSAYAALPSDILLPPPPSFPPLPSHTQQAQSSNGRGSFFFSSSHPFRANPRRPMIPAHRMPSCLCLKRTQPVDRRGRARLGARMEGMRVKTPSGPNPKINPANSCATTPRLDRGALETGRMERSPVSMASVLCEPAVV